jgi:hypothetical protein
MDNMKKVTCPSWLSSLVKYGSTNAKRGKRNAPFSLRATLRACLGGLRLLLKMALAPTPLQEQLLYRSQYL